MRRERETVGKSSTNDMVDRGMCMAQSTGKSTKGQDYERRLANHSYESSTEMSIEEPANQCRDRKITSVLSVEQMKTSACPHVSPFCISP